MTLHDTGTVRCSTAPMLASIGVDAAMAIPTIAQLVGLRCASRTSTHAGARGPRCSVHDTNSGCSLMTRRRFHRSP